MYSNNSWEDGFYKDNNNTRNFKLNEFNNIFKTKKISKFQANERILFSKNNLILSDNKGNLITFSLDNNSIISSFNFIKKNLKNEKN